jgi:hypothetical protein
MGANDVDTKGTSIQALEDIPYMLRGRQKQWLTSSNRANDLKINEVVSNFE